MSDDTVDYITDGDVFTFEEVHTTLHEGDRHSRYPSTPGPATPPPAVGDGVAAGPASWRRTRRIKLGDSVEDTPSSQSPPPAEVTCYGGITLPPLAEMFGFKQEENGDG